MSSLFGAAGMEQPASIDGPLGRLGSSYLDADYILVGCPSRDAFLLPDELEEPAAAAAQHSTTPSTGQQQHSQPCGGVGGNPGRTPAGGPFSTAAGVLHHRTTPSAHILPNSSSTTWDSKPGAGIMPPALAHVSRAGLHGAQHSPLLSARTAAALMSGEEDVVQQAGLDLLDGTTFSLPSLVEGELQWGTAGAHVLDADGPPTRGLTGFGAAAGSTARFSSVQSGPWDGPTAGQQYQSQQQRLLHASFPAGYSSPPAATSRQHSQHTPPGAYHPRHEQQHHQQQPRSYVGHQRSPQQQLQQGMQHAAWQHQHQQQMQQAYLQQQHKRQQVQQQLGAHMNLHAGFGSSRPVARVLQPPGIQAGHFPAQGLQHHQHAHQHRQQQQQPALPQGMQHPALQQQWPAGSPAAAGRASAVGGLAGGQGQAGAAAVAAAFPGRSKADCTAGGATAALHTWGSNTSSMTAAIDSATASHQGGVAAVGSSKADTPTDSTAAAAAAAAAGSDALVQQQRQQQQQGVVADAAAPALQESASPPANAAAEAQAANTAAAAAKAGAASAAHTPAGELTTHAATAAAAAAAASSPGKDRPSPIGAGMVTLSSANSASMGDSSHDSSQTQQQDAGSAAVEPPPSKADASGVAAGAAAAAVGPTDGAPGDAEGGQEGAANQQRIFHHKGGGPCDHCGVMESPQWRRGPPAKPILCNACGTRYRRTHHLGPPIPSGGRLGGGRPAVAGGSSGRGSSGGSTPGRKRAAAAEALGPVPLPVNYEGGVHTGTRLARNPNRPAAKQHKPDDV